MSAHDREGPEAPPARPDEGRRSRLLHAARQALVDWLESGRSPAIRHGDRPSGGDLSLFVTLRSEGKLRGCIGLLDTDMTIEDAVRECAVSAGNDPRFNPLGPEEMEDLRIEISILADWTTVSGPGDVEIGRHGLVIEQGGRRGLLLPQVAVEHGWDAEAFLEEVCAKALLPRDAWKKGGVVRSFSAEVFAEEPPTGPSN